MNDILKNWTILRVLKLALGIYIGIDSFKFGNWFILAFAVFLVYQSIMNIGCGGKDSCPT